MTSRWLRPGQLAANRSGNASVTTTTEENKTPRKNTPRWLEQVKGVSAVLRCCGQHLIALTYVLTLDVPRRAKAGTWVGPIFSWKAGAICCPSIPQPSRVPGEGAFCLLYTLPRQTHKGDSL